MTSSPVYPASKRRYKEEHSSAISVGAEDTFLLILISMKMDIQVGTKRPENTKNSNLVSFIYK